ncbi:MAG: DNA topoisomerase III [Betaproteobacteria bacterium]|nr:MAG: DNA topoisomerase III [Betaproteobacteria bacterium]
MKTLIIAEKPSVASDLAKALGNIKKDGDHFENEQYVISSAIGHLVEIGEPETEEVKRGKWTFAKLPVIPSHFELKPIEKTADRLRQLTRLIKRKDVTKIINACDAGREGELIFRLIQEHAKAKQPVQRLWLQSMTQGAIRDAFANLRSDEQMLPLADAARCRSEADWLVGINGTRAMTAFNTKSGGFHLTTVGRVQTPTLALMVEREDRIRKFVTRTYFEIHATFDAKAGQYAGRWFDEKFKKGDDEHARAERIFDSPDAKKSDCKARAEAIAAKCLGKLGIVEEESKPTTQAPPLLYDLTSLQREANSRFGFSARTTLSLAQSLYEKHKVLTYPRTDARALPEDYVKIVGETLQVLEETNRYGTHAREIRTKKYIRPANKRVFDNSKISDHFAIIPTLQLPKTLNELEEKLYDLVTKRFLSVFFPSAEFQQTTRITRVENEAFKSEGKVMVNAGWLAVYGKEVDSEETGNLTPVAAGEKPKASEVNAKELVTKPPARYSEATLLSAMEGAGKLIDDEELRAAMQEKGLGTPATRASIIEGLIIQKYLLREDKALKPTPQAFSLITLLNGLNVPQLTSPELTANWETQLARMEKGQISREKFMAEIVDMAKHIVAQAKGFESDTVPGDFADLKTPCPKCGSQIKENYKKFSCTKCDFGFWKILASRQLSVEEAETLIRDKKVENLEGFRSKLGRTFNANLRMNDAQEIEFYWDDNEGTVGEGADPVDFSTMESIGKCPKCGAGVFELETAYICEVAAKKDKPRKCDFRSGRVILQQPIEREQMVKLLTEGKTDLLTNFVSTKTKRPFKGYLVVERKKNEVKVGFEFPPREPKAPKAVKGSKAVAQVDEEVEAPAAKPAKPTAVAKATKASTGAAKKK